MQQVFAARKEEAVRRWSEAIFALYPFETTGFLRTQKDRFANPVGHATEVAAGMLFDAISGQDVAGDAMLSSLGEMIRIRAVQDLTPAKAVGALYLLKPILRDMFLTQALSTGKLEHYLGAESRLDTLALMAFDLYMADKEVVYAARVTEQKRRTAQLERWVASGERPRSDTL